MSTEANKAVVRRYYEEVLSKRNPDLVDELCAPDYKYHYPDVPPNLPAGLEGFKQFVTKFLSGFSDLEYVIEDQVAEGDKVATRLTVKSATSIGPLKSPPTPPGETAKAANIPGISIERVVNGKIVESWAEFDLLSTVQELGVPPVSQPH